MFKTESHIAPFFKDRIASLVVVFVALFQEQVTFQNHGSVYVRRLRAPKRDSILMFVAYEVMKFQKRYERKYCGDNYATLGEKNGPV